jgi:transcriptional regulator with XRE-family HTH domain
MINSAQLRAARGMLKLSIADVAGGAEVSRSTVQRAEQGPVHPPVGARNLAKIEGFFNSKGVRFEGGATRMGER